MVARLGPGERVPLNICVYTYAGCCVGFVQLDLVLSPLESLSQIKQIRSDRWQALASHHFLLEVVVEIQTTREEESGEFVIEHPRYNLSLLSNGDVRSYFVQRFNEIAQGRDADSSTCEQSVDNLCASLHSAAADVLPSSDCGPTQAMGRIWYLGADLCTEYR